MSPTELAVLVHLSFRDWKPLASMTLREGYLQARHLGTLGFDSIRAVSEEKNWRNVHSKYIQDFIEGLPYLPSDSLRFYFPGLMTFLLVETFEQRELCDVLDTLLYAIEIHQSDNHDKPTFLENLTAQQKTCTSSFLDIMAVKCQDSRLRSRCEKIAKTLIFVKILDGRSKVPESE